MVSRWWHFMWVSWWSGCCPLYWGPPAGFAPKSIARLVTPANSSVNHPFLPVTSERFTLLGSLTGSPEHCLITALGRIKKVQYAPHRLSDLDYLQMEATVLRSHLSLPKVAYFICTCPPGLIQGTLEEADNTMKEIVLGCPLSNWVWGITSFLPG